MAFSVPAFNLLASVWHNPNAPPAPADIVGLTVNLSPGRRINLVAAQNGGGDPQPLYVDVLCPKLTDIRSPICAGGADIIEVPQGSGRLYRVVFMDDVAKNFTNEYRLAVCQQIGPWAVPVP